MNKMVQSKPNLKGIMFIFTDEWKSLLVYYTVLDDYIIIVNPNIEHQAKDKTWEATGLIIFHKLL